MPEADQATVNQMAGQIDFTRDGIESSYGKDAQRATSTFADEILSDTRSKDTGEAGELLNTMLVTIDEADLGGFRTIPIIGQVAVSVDKLRRRYQKVDAQIDEIIVRLESAQAKLVADISMYDTMYTQNAQQYRELKMTVLAGKKALADFNANQLPALEAEAAASGDAMQAQVLKDFKSKLDRFAKRLDDLDRISVVTLQTAPQIKIIQNADQTIVDKIDTTPRPQKRLARKRPADVSRSRASMLPLAEVYEYAYWCAYICSRWRELAAVRLAEGGHGARLGRLYRQPFPAAISLWA